MKGCSKLLNILKDFEGSDFKFKDIQGSPKIFSNT